jgi:hypothetical protein
MGAIDKRRLPIFFMHVPKCGGSTLATLLRRHFRPAEICPVPADGAWPAEAAPGLRYALYCGHFSMDFIDRWHGRGTKLLMLRHPLARVVSLYDYWRSYRWEYIRENLPAHNGPVLAKSLAFSDFLDHPHATANIYNACAAQLLGRRAHLITEDPPAATREAIAALQRFDWIGTAEDFSDSVARLTRQLGMRRPRVMPRENASGPGRPSFPYFEPVDKTLPSDADRRRILEGNRIDLAVYEAACGLAGLPLRRAEHGGREVTGSATGRYLEDAADGCVAR